MTRAAGMLLEATERDAHDGENRLTEILAAVLQGCPRLATALMTDLRLPAGESYEVNTQVYADGKFVDMELVSLDGRGSVLGRLWAEHKVYADFREGQMRDYLERLARRPAAGRALVGIVRSEELFEEPAQGGELVTGDRGLRPDPHAQAATPPGAEWRTWQDIAILASRVGRRHGGRRWAEALTEDAPAGQLLLEELISVLERKDLAFMDALDAFDVSVLASAESSRDVGEALWQRVLQHLEDTTLPPKTTKGTSGKSPRQILWMWQHLGGSSGSWAAQEPWLGWVDLVLRPTDDWRSEELVMDVPALGVGYTFEHSRAVALVEDDDLRRWREDLQEANGIDLMDDGQWVRCYGTMYLTNIVTAGYTLDDQARAVARWVRTTVDAIEQHPPT